MVAGPSFYQYVGNNPPYATDPTGMIGFGIDAFFYGDRATVMWGLVTDEFFAMFVEYTHGRVEQAFGVNECREVVAADRHAFWLSSAEPGQNLLNVRIPQYLGYSLMGIADWNHAVQIENRQFVIGADASAMALARTAGYRAMIAIYVVVAEFPIPFPSVLRTPRRM